MSNTTPTYTLPDLIAGRSALIVQKAILEFTMQHFPEASEQLVAKMDEVAQVESENQRAIDTTLDAIPHEKSREATRDALPVMIQQSLQQAPASYVGNVSYALLKDVDSVELNNVQIGRIKDDVSQIATSLTEAESTVTPDGIALGPKSAHLRV